MWMQGSGLPSRPTIESGSAASIGVISCGFVFGRLGRMTGAVMGLAYAGYMIQLG